MYGAVAFHYREPVTYYSDSSGAGYIPNDYVAVGDNNLPSPRPPDSSNSHINNPFDLLHFNYWPNNPVTAPMFQSFPPIPTSILENDSLIKVVHGSRYNLSVRYILNFF